MDSFLVVLPYLAVLPFLVAHPCLVLPCLAVLPYLVVHLDLVAFQVAYSYLDSPLVDLEEIIPVNLEVVKVLQDHQDQEVP